MTCTLRLYALPWPGCRLTSQASCCDTLCRTVPQHCLAVWKHVDSAHSRYKFTNSQQHARVPSAVTLGASQDRSSASSSGTASYPTGQNHLAIADRIVDRLCEVLCLSSREPGERDAPVLGHVYVPLVRHILDLLWCHTCTAHTRTATKSCYRTGAIL